MRHTTTPLRTKHTFTTSFDELYKSSCETIRELVSDEPEHMSTTQYAYILDGLIKQDPLAVGQMFADGSCCIMMEIDEIERALVDPANEVEVVILGRNAPIVIKGSNIHI